jgi:hypothetical protein
MLYCGKKYHALHDKKNKYSNSCVNKVIVDTWFNWDLCNSVMAVVWLYSSLDSFNKDTFILSFSDEYGNFYNCLM